MMDLGLVCRGDHGGLATLSRDFRLHLQPVKTLGVDMDRLTGNTSRLDTDYIYVPGAGWTQQYCEQVDVIDRFLDGLDVVLTWETPYNYYLFSRARELGVRSILGVDYEYLIYEQPDCHLPRPDLLVVPTINRLRELRRRYPAVHLPIPVDRERWRHTTRTRCDTLLHIANPGADLDRNGTRVVESATLPDGVDLVIPSRVSDNRDLYATGDVLVMTRRYGDLSLPIQEALALGMPVITSQHDYYHEGCVPIRDRLSSRRYQHVDVWDPDTTSLSETIAYLHDTPLLVAMVSEAARSWADKMSWDNQMGRWMDVLDS